MPTSYTSLLGLALPVTGELSGTWGDTVNQYITQYVDAAVAGAQTISGTQTAVTLSVTNGASLTQAGSGATGSAQYQIINCTGSPASALTVTVPSASKVYLVLNNTSTNQTVTVKGAATTGVTVAAGRSALIAWNGTDFELVATDDASKISGILAVANGGTGLSSGTSGGIPYFSGSTTMASSAALAANALVVGGGAGAAPSTVTTGTGVVTALGVNTGSAGAFVVNGGALGTPSSGTVTNLTGTASININGTVGATTPNTGAFTTLAASSTVSGTGFSNYLASPPAIGGTTPNTGAFTSVTSTSAAGVLTRAAATQDGVELIGRAGGTTSLKVSITPTTLTASRTLTAPDNSGTILTTGATVTVAQGGTGATTLTGVVKGNGTSAFTAGTVSLTSEVAGTLPVANGGTGVTTSTGSGSVVLSSSPALTTPNLGTPSAATLTNATGLPLSTGVTGTLPVANGGTGQTSYTDGQLLIGNTATTSLSKATLTAGSGVSITNGNGTITIAATGSGGTVTSVGQTFTGGLISVSGSPVTGSGTLALTVAGTSGGIPYFSSASTWATSAALAANSLVVGGGAGVAPSTITTGTGVVTALGTAVGSAGAFVVNGGALGTPSSGTVTNLTGTASININGTVGATTPNTGAFTSVTSTSASGILTRAAASQDGVELIGRAGGTLSYKVSITPTTLTASRTVTLPDANIDFTTGLAVANGGTGSTTASGARTNLGATTVGANFFTLTNPTAVTFPRINADNTVSALDAATFRSAIGAGTGSGTVTSVSGTGTVQGLTLSGTVTSSGSLTLSGSLSAVSLTTQVSGTLPVANGGTGVTSSTGSGNVVLSTSPTLVTPILGTPTSGTLSNCTVDGTNAVGYRNLPPVGTKTASYTLATGDVGKYVQLSTGGAIVIPTSTFAEGDAITLFNNTTGNITITCSAPTAYIAGTNTVKTSMTLATRGVATVLFISSTLCVVTGNVT